MKYARRHVTNRNIRAVPVGRFCLSARFPLLLKALDPVGFFPDTATIRYCVSPTAALTEMFPLGGFDC